MIYKVWTFISNITIRINLINIKINKLVISALLCQGCFYLYSVRAETVFFFHTASSYLSSWCSGRPAAAGRAAGEDEAGCSELEEHSAAPEDCCCSSRSHSCRGMRQLRGSTADPEPPHWRDSRWSTLSDGRCCEAPQGSPYWNRNRNMS